MKNQKGIKIFIILLAGLMLQSHIPPACIPYGVNNQEYAYKAAFIYHFTEYITWEKFDEFNTFNIGVLGESPIIRQLEIIAGEKKIKNKQLIIYRYENLEEVQLPQILYVPKNSPYSVRAIANRFAEQPVLIVTEHQDYERKEGHINFFIANDKLRFEINLNAINKTGIKVSSQLLQHAASVN